MWKASLVDPVVDRGARRLLNPAVRRGHEAHRPETLQQQTQCIRLVIVTVPDPNFFSAAERKQTRDDAPVPRASIRYRDEWGVVECGLGPNGLITGIARGMEVCTHHPVAERFEKLGRIENGLVGTTAGTRNDPRVQNERQILAPLRRTRRNASGLERQVQGVCAGSQWWVLVRITVEGKTLIPRCFRSRCEYPLATVKRIGHSRPRCETRCRHSLGRMATDRQ